MVLSPYVEHCISMRRMQKQCQQLLTFGPIILSHKPVCRQPVSYIHHRHLSLLLSPKADTHFTIPQRVEG